MGFKAFLHIYKPSGTVPVTHRSCTDHDHEQVKFTYLQLKIPLWSAKWRFSKVFSYIILLSLKVYITK